MALTLNDRDMRASWA